MADCGCRRGSPASNLLGQCYGSRMISHLSCICSEKTNGSTGKASRSIDEKLLYRAGNLPILIETDVLLKSTDELTRLSEASSFYP